MKKLVVIILFTILFTSCAGIHNVHIFRPKIRESYVVKFDSVPTSVVQAFQKKYAGIVADEWYKVGKRHYAARFTKGNTTAYAYFSVAGVFTDEEVDDQDYYDPYDDLDPWDWDYNDEY
jgi:hypothetical protein